jgi:hypothetical protein
MGAPVVVCQPAMGVVHSSQEGLKKEGFTVGVGVKEGLRIQKEKGFVTQEQGFRPVPRTTGKGANQNTEIWVGESCRTWPRQEASRLCSLTSIGHED